MNCEIKKRLSCLGYDPDDCPYTPIKPAWERYPMVKAIRQAERDTGHTYTNPVPMEEDIQT